MLSEQGIARSLWSIGWLATFVLFLGFLPASAANYLTTKISSDTYAKWHATQLDSQKILLVANPVSQFILAGEALFLYQNHQRKKISTAAYSHWSFLWGSGTSGNAYLLDGLGPNSSAIYLYDGATTKKISNSDYAFWNAEWCGKDILLYGSPTNLQGDVGKAVYLYKNGAATKISANDFPYWQAQGITDGVLLYGNKVADAAEDEGVAVYLYRNGTLKKISTDDYNWWSATDWGQQVLLDGESKSKSEIYLYDGSGTKKINPATYPVWNAEWLDQNTILMAGNPRDPNFGIYTEAEAFYLYKNNTAVKITNATYKYWYCSVGWDKFEDGVFTGQLLLDGRTADKTKSVIYLYKNGNVQLISPAAYPRWDACWDYFNNQGRIILVANPVGSDYYAHQGEAIYLYTGTNAFKISKGDYKYWDFGFDPWGYTPKGQLLMTAGNKAYEKAAVYLYKNGATSKISPAGYEEWEAQWDDIDQIVMMGRKGIYPSDKREIYLYQGSTTPKISTADYPMWWCDDNGAKGKHLLQGNTSNYSSSGVYLFNLSSTVKISPAAYKFWYGVWHNSKLAILIGDTSYILLKTDGKVIYLHDGSPARKISTQEYPVWEYLRNYSIKDESAFLLLKGSASNNSRSSIYLVEPDTRPLTQYSFTFKYNNGQGDWYKGYFFAPTGYSGYKVGYTKSVVDENKQTGQYVITAAQDIGQDSLRCGQVFVTKYYDGDRTKKTFTPVNSGSPLGYEFLGSEIGYIKNAGVAAYKFGQGYYEADAGDTYSFRYVYGNGDHYVGKVYRDPLNTAYYPGLKIKKTNELGLNGYYEITGISHNAVDSSWYGRVFVTKYYDGDKNAPQTYTGNTLLPAIAANSYFGANYLSSEYGYIGSRTSIDAANYFGGGYYEADL